MAANSELTPECRCIACGHVSKTKETFKDLSLPIPDKKQRSRLTDDHMMSGMRDLDEDGVRDGGGVGWNPLDWFMCAASGSSSSSIITQPLSVETCVGTFCAPEMLTEDEKITCEACNYILNYLELS